MSRPTVPTLLTFLIDYLIAMSFFHYNVEQFGKKSSNKKIGQSLGMLTNLFYCLSYYNLIEPHLADGNKATN